MKTWKVALLLCIIIPVSLLTAFKLTGIIGGPASEPIEIAETKTLEPAKWELERPNYSTAVTENYTSENVTTAYSINDFSINSTITVNSFDASSDYGSSACLHMKISASASVLEGHVVNVNIIFYENYTASQVYLFELRFAQLDNLSITNSVGGNQLSDAPKAFISMATSNSPKEAGFRNCIIHWVLRSPYNQMHQLEVNIQSTYFNGTAYKKVIQPFLLKIWPDDNNSFETAEELGVNQTRRAYIEYSGYGVDIVDYYKIWLQNDITADLILNYIGGGGIEVQVHDPSKNLAACLLNQVNSSSKQITLDIKETGWWYIKLTAPDTPFFIYTITVKTQED